eukprot:m.341212 g.341212  ORF g.341212 m.341212 type:complete len:649 (+) comp19915_c0_seq1:285-2231(+)
MLFDASTLEIEADLPRDGDKMSPKPIASPGVTIARRAPSGSFPPLSSTAPAVIQHQHTVRHVNLHKPGVTPSPPKRSSELPFQNVRVSPRSKTMHKLVSPKPFHGSFQGIGTASAGSSPASSPKLSRMSLPRSLATATLRLVDVKDDQKRPGSKLGSSPSVRLISDQGETGSPGTSFVNHSGLSSIPLSPASFSSSAHASMNHSLSIHTTPNVKARAKADEAAYKGWLERMLEKLMEPGGDLYGNYQKQIVPKLRRPRAKNLRPMPMHSPKEQLEFNDFIMALSEAHGIGPLPDEMDPEELLETIEKKREEFAEDTGDMQGTSFSKWVALTKVKGELENRLETDADEEMDDGMDGKENEFDNDADSDEGLAEDSVRRDEILQVIGASTWEVTLQRESLGIEFGFDIISPALYVDEMACGTSILTINPNSPCARHDDIHIGDLIVEVNGIYVLEGTEVEVLDIVRKSGLSVVLTLASTEPDGNEEEGEDEEEEDDDADDNYADTEMDVMQQEEVFAALLLYIPRTEPNEVIQEPKLLEKSLHGRLPDDVMIWAEAHTWLELADRASRKIPDRWIQDDEHEKDNEPRHTRPESTTSMLYDWQFEPERERKINARREEMLELDLADDEELQKEWIALTSVRSMLAEMSMSN